MSQPPEQLHEPIADLPNPELNPLLNPILGRHLGQWAHVYFTTSPEKREESLYELLEQLKAEEARNGGPSPGIEEVRSAEGIYAIVCPHCHRSNVRSQKYCGMCGSLMPVRAQAAAAATSAGAFGEALFAPAHESQSAAEVSTTDSLSHTAWEASPEADLMEPRGAFTPTSLLFQPAVEAEPDVTKDNRPSKPVDIDWLRQRNIPTHTKRESRFRGAGIGLGIAALMCLALFIYVRTESRIPHAKQSDNQNGTFTTPQAQMPTSRAQSEPKTAVSPPTFDALPPPQPRDSQLGSQNRDRNTRANEHTFAVSPGVGAVTPKSSGKTSTSAPPPPAAAGSEGPANPADASENGSQEVAAARDYLSGKKGPSNGGEAAKLLWKAVAKQNGGALLMLSDLYASGNGVPKSCDQARLLLDAALRKGVSTAGAKFRELQKTCP